jgi:hypothetical protein
MKTLFILLIVLAILLFLFIATILTFIIFFLIRKRTVIWIKQANKSWKTKVLFKLNLPEKIVIDKKVYVIDKDSFIRSKWSQNLYYYDGVMYPMNFSKEQAITNANIKLIDGNITQRILKSDLVEKLITTDNMKAILLILVIVTLLIGIGTLITNFTGSSVCTLIGDNQTINVIAQGVRSGIGR